MESDGSRTTAQARTVLKELLAGGGDPKAVAAHLGFEAMAVDDLAALVDKVVAEHPDEWDRYTAGEDKVAGFLIGQVKAASDGKADLKAAAALLRARRA
jgi:Asp-tRNA(Asn)/Glu-tRNA(Gln) amidotransferase B subunit